MQLPEGGKFDQHTTEYQEKLKARKIKLPAIAYAATTPNFLVDVTSLPETILKEHGFIR